MLRKPKLNPAISLFDAADNDHGDLKNQDDTGEDFDDYNKDDKDSDNDDNKEKEYASEDDDFSFDKSKTNKIKADVRQIALWNDAREWGNGYDDNAWKTNQHT